MSDVTVITATLPQRTGMLADAIASVSAQIVQPDAHHIAVDHRGQGPVPTLNQMTPYITTGWFCLLDDDDVLYPNHISTLAARRDDADIVFGRNDTAGGVFRQYNHPFNPADTEHLCNIAPTALVRTSLAARVGWWEGEHGYDWRFWQRCLAAGARVIQVADTTWEYRLHGRNHSREGVAA